jgi:hypothetical protein
VGGEARALTGPASTKGGQQDEKEGRVALATRPLLSIVLR